MKTTLTRALRLPVSIIGRGAAMLLLLGGTTLAAAQCVSLTTPGAAVTQNFDTLSSTAGSTTNNLTLTGWFLTESGGGARDNEQYAVDTGGSNTGDTYSYGPAGNTDRALGGLQSGTLIPLIGACFTNNTGSTLTSLDVAYTGEQWRIGNTAAARDDRLDFELSQNATSLTTGTWTGVDALDFVNPIKTAGVAGALDGNQAANRTAISASIGALSIANGATFWIRWTDLNATGADDGLSVDNFSLTPQGGAPVNTLSVNDVALAEGNAGTTAFAFTVSLTAPAPPGGVTFDIATADGSAQDGNPVGEDNDYFAQSLAAQSIPAGSATFAFSVQVNGDSVVEPNETFFVNVTNVTGATVGDGQGQGTIQNDDVALTPIHDIQGPGASSPIVGASVTTRGIVTGVRSNGFFLQEPDASVDADPATSEGIFVFTSSAPPVAVAVGNLVQVTGTVTEFVPVQDPLQPPLTELTSPTVTLLSSGNPLPAPIPLNATFPDPSGPHDQLERLEGMRVSTASLTVVAPTGGSINEVNATSTSNGVFFATVTGVARPFREPGIQAPDPAPAGTIPPIPRWDSNPELLRVDSDGLVGAAELGLTTGHVVTGAVGVLDYGFRRYTVLPDPGASLVVTSGMFPQAVTPPAANEFTVASYNLQRFFDSVDDPGIGEPVLTPAALDTRLAKASAGIRDFLRTPDILGVIEVENLSTLQALAARISSDATAASQPDPQYQAFLVEGSDVGGIDVGFLVKTAPVVGATPRVDVIEVVQENAAELFVNPDSSTELLNDRPPLRLRAAINRAGAAPTPITVIVNHLRSFNDAASVAPGSNGWATLGERVRAKRQAQAASLANLIQTRQTGDPAERIAVIGDFNAFQFNDGLGDSIGTVLGTPVPDNETAVVGDGVDLVNPDLVNLLPSAAPGQRYSYTFDGNAQAIDHVLVNAALVGSTTAQRLEFARLNADFPEFMRAGPDATRLSDHDPMVAYFAEALAADVSIVKTDTVDPATAGGTLGYDLAVSNAGPDAAADVMFSDTLPAGTTFASLTAPGGWSCTTPAVGAGGTVSCSNATFAPGSAAFTLTVTLDPALAAGAVLSNTATVSTTSLDPDPANNSATATTTVTTAADLALTKTDTPDPVVAGSDLTYTLTLTNAGPSDAAVATLSDTLPAGTAFVSLTAPGGWSCSTPAVGSAGTVSCSQGAMASGSAVFTLVVAVDPGLAAGSVLNNTATATSTTPDPNPGNESATAATTVSTSADLALTLTDAPDPVAPGAVLTYVLTATNVGPSTASTTLSGTLPAGTSFASLLAGAGWSCTTPAVGAGGAVSCVNATFAPGNAAFTLGVTVDPGLAAGSVISFNALVASGTADPNPGNEAASADTTVGSGSADLSVVMTDAPDPVAAGGTLVFTIDVTNAGPAAATDATLSSTLPAGTTFVSLTAPGGWSCTTPAVGAGGTVTCAQPGFLPGSASFTLALAVDAASADGSVVTNSVAIASATTDPAPGNNAATTTTTVTASADLSLTLVDTPDPVLPGGQISYALTATNAGPNTATTVTWSDTLPAGTGFVSLSAAAGWTCTTPAVGAGGTVTCNAAMFAPGTDVFTLVLSVDAGSGGSTLVNSATLTSATPDPVPANNVASASTTVSAPAQLSGSKTASGSRVPGGALSYSIVLSNTGAGAQPDNPGDEFVDVLPADLVLVSASASSGTVVATVGTNTVTWNGSLAPGASVTIVIQTTIATDATPGGVITNQGTIRYDGDGNGSNEASALTDDPTTGAAGDGTSITLLGAVVTPPPVLIPSSSLAGNLLLAAMVLLLAVAGLRRRVG